ncbi:MAG: hypothetical protein P3W94_006610 [Paracoccus sp. (in: a-proteobacteria)]|nr:hypothetical protein [Paracoccus sp. (in: a-proteobacteria)]
MDEWDGIDTLLAKDGVLVISAASVRVAYISFNPSILDIVTL